MSDAPPPAVVAVVWGGGGGGGGGGVRPCCCANCAFVAVRTPCDSCCWCWYEGKMTLDVDGVGTVSGAVVATTVIACV